MTLVRSHQQLLNGNKLLILFAFFMLLMGCNASQKTIKKGKDITVKPPQKEQNNPSKSDEKSDNSKDDKPLFKKTVSKSKPNLNKVYEIAVVLPLDVRNTAVDSVKFNSKLDFPLSFYKGMKLALQNQKLSGLQLQVKLIDGTTDVLNFNSLEYNAKQESDICMVFNRFDKPYVFLENKTKIDIEPDRLGIAHTMYSYLKNNFLQVNVVSIAKDSSSNREVQKTFDSLLTYNGISHSKFIGIFNANTIISKLKQGSINVIYISNSEQAYVETILTALKDHINTYSIVFFGDADWNKYRVLEPQLLNEVQLYLFTDFFPDYNFSETKQFRRSFKSEYGYEPDEMAYRAYDFTLSLFEKLKLDGIEALAEYGPNIFEGLGSAVEYKKLNNNYFKNYGRAVVLYKDFVFTRQYQY